MKTEEDLLTEIVDGVAELGLKPAPLAPVVPMGFNGQIFLSLHTAEPRPGGNLHEASYAGYVRVDITSRLLNDQGAVENVDEIRFPQCTGGGETLTHIAIWKNNEMLLTGPMASPTYVDTGTWIQMAPHTLHITI